LGWEQVEKLVNLTGNKNIPDLSHSQIQTLLGAIGTNKDYDVWIPANDRLKLDWKLTQQFNLRENLPYGFERIQDILSEIDVIWIKKGANDVKALFDVHLTAPELRTRFSIVANIERRSLFVKQLNRPTFRTSGLGDLCTFLDYTDVHNWHQRGAVR